MVYVYMVTVWITSGELLVLSYQIDKASEPVLLVKKLQDGTERKGDGEEHGGVAAAGCMRALQQPQRVTNHI